MKKGYFGIGVFHPKTEDNIGTLWRSAQNFGASFLFTIGRRYKTQSTDTTKASRHIPLYHYLTYDSFTNNRPLDCRLVFVEQSNDSKSIKNFIHPERCIYLLGAEDHGIPISLMKGQIQLHIDTPVCLNVAVAGSIVMFHREL